MQFHMFLHNRFIDYPPYIKVIFSLPVERICFAIGVLCYKMIRASLFALQIMGFCFCKW
jgi:hypothetical protein